MGIDLIALTVAFCITSAITRFDICISRGIRSGELSASDRLSRWIVLVYYVHWGIGLALLILNWKYALFVFAVKVALSFFGILQVAGSLMMLPFLRKKSSV